MFAVLIVTLVQTGVTLLHKALRETEELRDIAEEQTKLLSTTFSTISDIIITYNSNFEIITLNDAAKKFFSFLDSGADTPTFFELPVKNLPEGKTLGDYLQFHKGTIKNERIQITCNNRDLWFELSSSTVDDSASIAVLVQRDINEQVIQEQHLIQAQKMDALGQLSSGVAHDFNNMLGGIIGAVELIDSKLTPEEQKMLEMIKFAAEKASNLTKELLVFSRKAPSVSTQIDIHTIVKETSFLFERTIDKQIDIELDLQAENSLVVGDDTLIQNALINMGVNASHAMPDGGTLTFRTEITELDEQYCSNSDFDIEPGHFLTISVQDTGAGMSEEIQQHIFEPFFTTKEVGKGTGLGMASVYGMVQKHNGAITLYSEPGQGTVFHIMLPIEMSDTEVIPDQVRATPLSGTGAILVVDDDTFIRITSKAMLETLGYDVTVASEGEEALNIIDQKRFDAIILDMIMPKMNG